MKQIKNKTSKNNKKKVSGFRFRKNNTHKKSPRKSPRKSRSFPLKHKYNYKGGDLIAQGGYGCVFRPALQCPLPDGSGYSARPENTISKVMDKENAEKELEETKVVDRIDPGFEFHLPSAKICNYAYEIHDNEPGMDNCNVYKNTLMASPGRSRAFRNRELRVLQYVDGGIAIKELLNRPFLKDEVNLKRFMKSFFSIIQGLSALKNNRYCHLDLKTENIVINLDTMKIRMIDFGLASSVEDKVGDPEFLDFGYHVYPYETYLATDENYEEIVNGMIDVFQKMESNYKYGYQKTLDIKLFDTVNKNKSLYMNTWSEISIRKYIQQARRMEHHNFASRIIEKIDTFSVGIILLDILRKIIGKPISLISMRDEYTPLQKKIYVLASMMTKTYFMERIDPNDAVIYYRNEILPLCHVGDEAGAGAPAPSVALTSPTATARSRRASRNDGEVAAAAEAAVRAPEPERRTERRRPASRREREEEVKEEETGAGAGAPRSIRERLDFSPKVRYPPIQRKRYNLRPRKG